MERKRRSIAKAVSWRFIASLITIMLVYIFTGELIISLGVGATEAVSKMCFYFVHERVWTQIAWGFKR